ncbi:MAG TPA: DUF6279 family lipoprotein [Polyangiales bacterium]|nr:DUF6279 family lipoprotein [Polyangiales bacterium]
MTRRGLAFRSRWPALLLLLGLGLAVGCTGVLQNLGARWATSKISEVFDLDEAQEQATRAAVERTMASAPEVLGPRLDLLVATVDRALCKGLDEENMLIIERQIDVMLDKAAAWIIDESAPILATLSEEQIAHAQRELDERLQETRDELDAPPQERLASRQDKFIDAIEEWAGRLSDQQERAIRDHVASMPDEAADRLRADERRLAHIADALRQRPDASEVRDLLWDAWKKREDWGPNTRSAEARRADGRKTLFFVYELLDAEQKDNLSARLHEMHEKVKRILGIAGAG